MKKTFVVTLFLVGLFPILVMADQTLVKFKGGIGVNPSSRPKTNTINVVGTSTGETVTVNEAVTNVVRSVNPGGQPWVIRDLRAEIKVDGRVMVDGRGLLLAGGNGIGTNGAQSVRARLFCGTVAHNSGLVALEPNGDFSIDDVLNPLPPTSCASPVLLIVGGGGRWFAAGIPKLDD